MNAKPLGLKEVQTTESSCLQNSIGDSGGASAADGAPQNAPRKMVFGGQRIGIGVIDFDKVVLRKTK